MPSAHAFVYGTLMADEVLRVLIKRVPTWKSATISGFKRSALRGQVYPAIVSTPGSEVEGKVLLDLTTEELRVLDAYEAAEYERITVQPRLEDGSDITADVYVYREEYRSELAAEPWDYAVWRSNHLHKWVSQLSPDMVGGHPSGMLS